MKNARLKIWNVNYYDERRKKTYIRYIWEFYINNTHIMSHRLGVSHRYTCDDKPVPYITKRMAITYAKRFVIKFMIGVKLEIDKEDMTDAEWLNNQKLAR